MTGLILKGVGGLYYVSAGDCIYECSARGRFRKDRITPTAGDTVSFTVLDEINKKGALDSVNERRNCLIRPKIANIDTVVITFAAAAPAPDFNLLDRFLILAQKHSVDNIIICFNKMDLSDDSFRKDTERIYKAFRVCFVSAEKNEGMDELRESLEGVSVLAGPSGVGKTSIINALIPESRRQTGEISRKIGRGKHTTRQVELIKSSEHSFLADTPGFTSLSLDFIKPEELASLYREFRDYPDKCRFADCAHITEPDCAVKEHAGEIPPERYSSYVNIYKELKGI